MKHMIRHSISCALLCGIALAAAPVAAQAEIRIGYVNTGRLLEESPQAQAAQQALLAEFMPRQRELAAQKKTLEEKADRLKREAAVMSEADRTKTEREVREGEINLSRRYTELNEDANLRRNEEFGKVQHALLQEVQVYARANGYQLVLSDGVLFAADTVDITAQVVAAIKAKAPAAAPAPKN